MVFLNKVASGDEIPDLNLAALHLAMPLLDVRPVRSRPVPFVARQLNKYVIAPQIVEYLAAHASRPYLQLFRYLNKTLQQCSCEKGAEADCESNDSLSRRNSELSDYSV